MESISGPGIGMAYLRIGQFEQHVGVAFFVEFAAKVGMRLKEAGENISASLAPIVTSLGKVGGGGYSSGTLDA